MKYCGIIPNDIVNGIGVCVSFWVQGCPEPHCKGCHNPKGWDFNGGMNLPKDYLESIDKAIIDNNVHRNFSVLGGEPLCKENIPLVKNVLEHVKKEYPDIKTFVWTKYIYEDIRNEKVFKYIDILIDGPFILKKRDVTLPLRGSDNQRIIDVKKSLKEKKTVVIPDSEFFK